MAARIKSPPGRGGPVDTRQRIVDAAVQCFERYGPQRTSMADIAEAAGISRKTLYRVFEDRPSLIEEVLNQRLYTLGEKVRKRISSYTDFEEALIEGSVVSIAAGRKDTLFNDVVQRESNHRLEQFLFRGNPQIQADMRVTWSPVIEIGRAQGLVRSDLTDERIVEIIISIHALLLMRDDYGPAKQRAYLKDVLVPAITARATDP